jgi:hypothetical protein
VDVNDLGNVNGGMSNPGVKDNYFVPASGPGELIASERAS